MLQAPSSQLSRVCGHGHIKKFWLMQTQNESQACENIIGGSTRPTPAAGAGAYSHWGAHPSKLSVPPSANSSASAAHRASDSRLSGLLTCAESLSPSTPCLFSDHHRSSPAATDLLPSASSEQHLFPRQQLSIEEAKRSTLLLCSTPASRSSPPTHSDVSDPSPASSRSGSDLVSTDSRAHPQVTESSSPHSPHHYRACDSSSTETDDDVSSAHQKGRATSFGKAVQQGHQMRSYPAAPKNAGRSPLFSEVVQQKPGRAVELSKPWEKFPVRSGAGISVPHRIGGPSYPSRDASSNVASSSQQHQLQSVRTCSVCGTSKTPLWRSGPKGPKSLCNACGIRYKKSRRLLQQQHQQPDGAEAGSNVASSSKLPSPTIGRSFKRKHGSNLGLHNPKLFKHSISAKLVAGGASFYQKKPQLPKLFVKSTEHRAKPSLAQEARHFFPVTHSLAGSTANSAKDEEEAAVLLMYLSCGLVSA